MRVCNVALICLEVYARQAKNICSSPPLFSAFHAGIGMLLAYRDNSRVRTEGAFKHCFKDEMVQGCLWLQFKTGLGTRCDIELQQIRLVISGLSVEKGFLENFIIS